MIKWPWTRKQLLAARPYMTRRRFLTALAAVPVAAAIAPELLDLLKPPKVISLPPRLAMSSYLTSPHAWYLNGGENVPTMYRSRSGIMTNAEFRTALTNDLNRAFREEYDKVAMDARVYGLGLARVKQEGDAIEYDHIPHPQAAEMVYQHQRYALGFQITSETDEDLTDYDALVRRQRDIRKDWPPDLLTQDDWDQVARQNRREMLRAYGNRVFTRGCSGSDHGYNQLEAATQRIQRSADGLMASVDRAVATVDALPAAAEDLARDIVTSPIDLVKRILRA